VVNRLDTNEEVYSQHVDTHFEDKLREKHVLFRVGNCTFPAAGWYQFTLRAGGERLCQRRVQVVAQEN
jgi:hypothetical protein